MIHTSLPLILASRSPRRAQLFKQIGLTFTQQESSVEEILDASKSPEENVQSLSLLKAIDVAEHFSHGIVVGSDTIVVVNGKILGKPSSEEEAFTMLRTLSSRTHTVFTGFALVDVQSKKNYVDFEKTDVTFRELDAEEIRNYIASGSPMDKAGAYGIQDDYGAVFVEKINGCYYTVVGFPLAKFYIALQKFIMQLSF